MTADLRQRYAQALAAQFTRPVPRYDRESGRDWVDRPEPADRVGDAMSVTFTASDGGPAIRMVTCEDAAEVCAGVRDEARREAEERAEQAEAQLARVRELCDVLTGIAETIEVGSGEHAAHPVKAFERALRRAVVEEVAGA